MNEKKTEFEGVIDYTILKEVLSALVAVTDRGVLRISEDGVTAKQVNPENTAMVSLDIKRGVFTGYNLNAGDLAVGVDFDKLLHILKLCEGDTKIEINTENEDTQSVSRTVEINSGYLSYNLPLIPLDALRGEPKLPELGFSAEVTIELEDFKRGINIAEDIASYVEIGMNSEEFFMGVESDEDKFRLAIPKEDLAHFAVGFSSGSEVKSKFTTDYLTRMANGVVGKSVTLKIRNDYPVQIPFTVTGGCEVVYLLAPRINQD